MRNRKSIAQGGDLRILCVGESTTALGEEKSYPAQLETILNDYREGGEYKVVGTHRVLFKRVSVINKGIPGITTTQVIDRLEDQLNRYEPHIVVAMMGVNDREELRKYPTGFLKKTGRAIRSLRIYKLTELLLDFSSKIAKRIGGHFFSQVTAENINESDPPGPFINIEQMRHWEKEAELLVEKGEYEKAEDQLNLILKHEPGHIRAHTLLAWVLHIQGSGMTAVDEIDKALKGDPDISEYTDTYVKAAHMYAYWAKTLNSEWLKDEAEQVFSKTEAILTQLLSRYPDTHIVYQELANCYIFQHKYQQALAVYRHAVESGVENKNIWGGLGYVWYLLGDTAQSEKYYRKVKEWEDKYYNANTRANFLALYDMVASRGIHLVCVQYPLRDIGPLKRIFIDHTGITFVDNEKTFKEALIQMPYYYIFADTFAGDFGHCTGTGNHILAANVAQSILREYFHIDIPPFITSGNIEDR
ncbi:MAG: tetratricopeptide repeat protein [Candidatus Omnitrophica bacterium]|nr:tetratricopeptide repeat protein [Candidatus Omnitrophota bacterium]